MLDFKNYFHGYLDVLLVFLTGGSALIVSYIEEINSVLRFGVLLATLGYGIWRWRADYIKHKKENPDNLKDK